MSQAGPSTHLITQSNTHTNHTKYTHKQIRATHIQTIVHTHTQTHTYIHTPAVQ